MRRYGAGELYGNAMSTLSAERLRELANSRNRDNTCPFKPHLQPCHKAGGVCTLTAYERDAEGLVTLSDQLVTTCPSRFLDSNQVFSWIGETLLGSRTPRVVGEVPFLMAERETEKHNEVGSIDNVLVHMEGDNMRWCALEMQAVYFSGAKMEPDFAAMRDWNGEGVPFPQGYRRPDYRSSGPKRLMPQLQIKVPTLRRWGKKMGVVIDLPFWNALGDIRSTQHLANSDIVWFVMNYSKESDGSFRLAPHQAIFTTLEHAVEGLTGGTPVPLEQFEASIRLKLARA